MLGWNRENPEQATLRHMLESGVQQDSGTLRAAQFSLGFCTTQQMMNEKPNQVLLLVGETHFEDQNTSTVKSACCVEFLLNGDDIRQLHFHFHTFSVFMQHVITFSGDF